MTYAGQLVAEEETDASQACRRAKQEGHVLSRDGQKEVDDLKRRTLDARISKITNLQKSDLDLVLCVLIEIATVG